MTDRARVVSDKLLGASDSESAPSAFGDTSTALKATAVLAFWTQCIQLRWSGWDQAREEAIKASRMTAAR